MRYTQRSWVFFRLLVITLSVAPFESGAAVVADSFSFESVVALDDMQGLLRNRFPLGTSRSDLRRKFVDEGRATLVLHPSQADVEKYIYDIDLCGYYVWRWNISADFDSKGRLRQAYVNGEPVFADGRQKKDGATLAKTPTASIFKMKRPRPEATKGENNLVFLLLDADSNLTTIDDQVLTGTGPSRSDPANLGPAHGYVNVEPWRSIFDFDSAEKVVPYSKDCAAADRMQPAPLRAEH